MIYLAIFAFALFLGALNAIMVGMGYRFYLDTTLAILATWLIVWGIPVSLMYWKLS